MQISLLYILLSLLLFATLLESKSKNIFKKSSKKKSSKPAKAAEPQPPIPAGLYRQDGKCYCPINADGSAREAAAAGGAEESGDEE